MRNNAVSGKTCENQRMSNDIRLLTDPEKLAKLLCNTDCLNLCPFASKLLGLELRNVKQIITQPSAVGFAVLELSKLHMLRCLHPPSLFLLLFFFMFSQISSNAITYSMIM